MLSLLVGHPWIQYILINICGFTIFTLIWTYLIPKPKPMDYTTIPGLKLDVDSEDDLPEWSIPPGRLVAVVAKQYPNEKVKSGHLHKISESGSFSRFLDRNEIIYGPLHSFWWSVRYTVVISSQNGLRQLQKYADAMLALSPLSTGSVLQGDVAAWTRVPAGSILTAREKHGQPAVWLEPSVQLSILERGPFRSDCIITQQETEVEQLRRVVPQLASILRSEGVERTVTYPLVISFNREIEILAESGAHPVPAFIPIILHTSAILRESNNSNLLEEYCNLFRWLPGMDDIDMLKILGSLRPKKIKKQSAV